MLDRKKLAEAIDGPNWNWDAGRHAAAMVKVDRVIAYLAALRAPEAADAGAVARSFAHYLANLEFQPTGKDPKSGGYAYARVPEWQLRQWAVAPTSTDRGGVS